VSYTSTRTKVKVERVEVLQQLVGELTRKIMVIVILVHKRFFAVIFPCNYFAPLFIYLLYQTKSMYDVMPLNAS
jgi:hypothetical protein